MEFPVCGVLSTPNASAMSSNFIKQSTNCHINNLETSSNLYYSSFWGIWSFNIGCVDILNEVAHVNIS